MFLAGTIRVKSDGGHRVAFCDRLECSFKRFDSKLLYKGTSGVRMASLSGEVGYRPSQIFRWIRYLGSCIKFQSISVPERLLCFRSSKYYLRYLYNWLFFCGEPFSTRK